MRTEEEINALLDKLEDFLKSYEDADNEYQTNQRRENWKSKFGERFKPYEDKIKILNGDEFDLMEESRNEYESQYSDLTEDEYCDALENNIKATLQRVWPDAEAEEIEQATEEIKDEIKDTNETEESAPEDESAKEEVHIESEDKDGDGEISKDETEIHTMEEKPEDDDEDDDEEDEEDPLDSFTKELEETKNSLPKRE